MSDLLVRTPWATADEAAPSGRRAARGSLVRLPLSELERVIDGDLIAGDELTTSRAPKPFNARFDEAIPQAVVRCTSPGDVAETISLIRRHGSVRRHAAADTAWPVARQRPES